MRWRSSTWLVLGLLLPGGLLLATGGAARGAKPEVQSPTQFPPSKPKVRSPSTGVRPAGELPAEQYDQAAGGTGAQRQGRVAGKRLGRYGGAPDAGYSSGFACPRRARQLHRAMPRAAPTRAFARACSRLGPAMVAYIPNNACLVRASAETARQLAVEPQDPERSPLRALLQTQPGAAGAGLSQ